MKANLPQPDDDWRQLLSEMLSVLEDMLTGGGAFDVLARMGAGTARIVQAACSSWLKENAILLDPVELTGATLAWIAYRGRKLEGLPPTEEWLDECRAKAVESLVRADVENEVAGKPPNREEQRLKSIVRTLGVKWQNARRVCLIVNGLPDKERKIFYALFIELRRLSEVARTMGMEQERVKLIAEKALVKVSRLDWGDGDRAAEAARDN